MVKNVSSRRVVLTFSVVMTLQIALQPFVSKIFTASSASKVSLVVACETIKLALACFLFLLGGKAQIALKSWTLKGSLTLVGLPAAIYAVQNVCLQFAYANCTPVVFQLLNQTKVFWSVSFMYLILGTKQTKLQCLSLTMLVTAAVIGSVTRPSEGGSRVQSLIGLAAGTSAAMLSGLASTLCQRTLQTKDRNTFLFGGELSVYGLLLLGTEQLMIGQSLTRIFGGWTLGTLIPVSTLAVYGVVTGMATKRVGNVVKGYAIVSGMLLTGFLEGIFANSGRGIGWGLWTALLLAAGSVLLRECFPSDCRLPSDCAKRIV